MLKSGYNFDRGNFNQGKFKIYGKNSTAQEFNVMAQGDQARAKYQPKVSE